MVGATAAVRGCSGRCVVDGETAVAQECFEQVRVEVGGSAAVRGCAAGACEQVQHYESHHVSRVEVAAERGSIDRTTGKGHTDASRALTRHAHQDQPRSEVGS